MLECPRCGSVLRYWDELHDCQIRNDQAIRYNLAQTDEEKVALSEAVRQVYGISPRRWYLGRSKHRCILQRLRRDGHPDPKVIRKAPGDRLQAPVKLTLRRSKSPFPEA